MGGCCFVSVMRFGGHFWHFMMGEFLPTVSVIATASCQELHLYNPSRKWNSSPLDHLYTDLEDRAPDGGGQLRVRFHSERPTLPGCREHAIERYDFSHLRTGRRVIGRGIDWLRQRAVKWYEWQVTRSRKVARPLTATASVSPAG